MKKYFLALRCEALEKRKWREAEAMALLDPPKTAIVYDSINFSPINTPDDQPHIWLHKVNHPSRIHLDIETDNIDAEVGRLKKLGATVFEKKEKWVVMEAPTGHRFCVVNPQRDDFDSSDQVNCWN